MYSISGPQDPADLPPSPPAPRNTVPPPLAMKEDLKDSQSHDIREDEGNKASASMSPGEEVVKASNQSPSPIVTSKNPSKKKLSQRRLSDGMLIKSIRSLHLWSPTHADDGKAHTATENHDDDSLWYTDNPLKSKSENLTNTILPSAMHSDGPIGMDLNHDLHSTIGSNDPSDSIDLSPIKDDASSNSSSYHPERMILSKDENSFTIRDNIQSNDFDLKVTDEESEENAEEKYKRAKETVMPSNNTTAFTPNRIQPKSNILSLRNEVKGDVSSNDSKTDSKPSKTKSAYERLYVAACLAKERKEKMMKSKEDDEMKEIVSNQFKMNEKSRAYSANKRRLVIPSNKNHSNSQPLSLHERLYEEAKYDLQRKNKIIEMNEEAKKSVPDIDTWSCAKCGTLHEVRRQPILSLYSFNVRDNHTENSKICKTCSWNQSNMKEFQPVNVGLELLPNDDETKRAMNSRKRFTTQQQAHAFSSIFGNDVNEETSMTIHDVLYRNTAKDKQSKLLYLDAITQIHNKENTFRPAIPQTSRDILQQKLDRVLISQEMKTDHDKMPHEDGNDSEAMTINHEAKLVAYFNQPIHERLYKTKHLRPDQAIELQHIHESNPSSSQFINRDIHQQPFIQKSKSTKQMNELVNRLVSEHDLKRKKLDQRSKEFHSKDPITGQQYFQPKIGPPPPTYYVNNVSTEKKQSKDIFEQLHNEAKKKQIHQNIVEEKKVKEIQNYQVKHRAHALIQSEAILQQSMEKSINELYRLLLATNIVIGYHQQHRLTSSMEELSLHISQIADELKENEGNDDWRHQSLDINQVNLLLLVPSVRKLVDEIKIEMFAIKKSNAMQGNNNPTEDPNHFIPSAYDGSVFGVESKSSINIDGVIDYEEFYCMTVRALKRREGIGKWYVIPPKNREDVVEEIIVKEITNHTFAPTMNEISKQLSENYRQHYRGEGVRTVDALYREAIVNEERRKYRQKIIQSEEEKELTFQPRLYRPPSNIKPKYRDPSNSKIGKNPYREFKEDNVNGLGAGGNAYGDAKCSEKEQVDKNRSASATRRELAEKKHVERQRSLSRESNRMNKPRDMTPSKSSAKESTKQLVSPSSHEKSEIRSSSTSALDNKPSISINSSQSNQHPSVESHEIEKILTPTRIIPSVHRTPDGSPAITKRRKGSSIAQSNYEKNPISKDSTKYTKVNVLPDGEKIGISVITNPHKYRSKSSHGSYSDLESYRITGNKNMKQHNITKPPPLPSEIMSSSRSIDTIPPPPPPPIWSNQGHLHVKEPIEMKYEEDEYFSTKNPPDHAIHYGHSSPISSIGTHGDTMPTDRRSSHGSSHKEKSSHPVLNGSVSKSHMLEDHMNKRLDEKTATGSNSLSREGSKRSNIASSHAAPHRSSNTSTNSHEKESGHTNNHANRSKAQVPSVNSHAHNPKADHVHYKDAKVNLDNDSFDNRDNRTSLSSMLTSLIHGDTPKAVSGKHIIHSPEVMEEY